MRELEVSAVRRAVAQMVIDANCRIGEETLGRIVPGSPAPLTRWTKDWQYIGIIGG